MKKVGIYPGSFNPWHAGHRDVLNKALEIFDHVYVVVMSNPDKEGGLCSVDAMILASKLAHVKNVTVQYSTKTLKAVVDNFEILHRDQKIPAHFSVIRGLRNGHDLQYEMNNQYWNEDIGMHWPFVYFITDRSLAHVSSSAIRNLKALGLKHDY
jgi:pantetheine-phosphate adenylyltransferase